MTLSGDPAPEAPATKPLAAATPLITLPWDPLLFRFRWVWITLILIAAVAVRAPLVRYHWVNYEDMGFYLANADEVRKGNWTWSNEYDITGSHANGFSLYRPFLYPTVTGLVGMLTGEVTLAGTLVNLAGGLLAILCTVLIAIRLGGSTVALLAGSLLAFNTFSIIFSTSRYSEMSYQVTLMGALWKTFRALDRQTAGRLLMAGALWGLAALARFEGQTVFMAALVLCLAWRLRLRAVWVVAGFLAVTAPIRMWGHFATPDPPQLDITVHTLVSIRMGGEMFSFIGYDIDQDLNFVTAEAARGRSALDVLVKERTFFTHHILTNLRSMPAFMAEHVLWGGLWIPVCLGGLLLLVLDRRSSEGRLLVLLSLVPPLLYSITYPKDRYFLGLLPIYLFMAAFAGTALARSVQFLAERVVGRRAAAGLAGLALIGISALVAVRTHTATPTLGWDPRTNLLPVERFQVLTDYVRENLGEPRVIAARDNSAGLECDARQIVLPHADRATVMRYLRRERAGYLIVDRGMTTLINPDMEEFTDPAAMAGDLDFVAQDPQEWYLLYQVRAEPAANVTPTSSEEAMANYLVSAAQTGRREFFAEELGLTPQGVRELAATQCLTAANQASREGRSDAAIRLALTSYALHPASAEVLAEATELARSSGRDVLPELQKHGITAENMRQLGLWWETNGTPEQALDAFTWALQIGPPHEEMQMGRHRALMKLLRFEEALDAARGAVSINPEHGWAHLYVGDALEALGRHAEALTAWQACIVAPIDGGSHAAAQALLARPATDPVDAAP